MTRLQRLVDDLGPALLVSATGALDVEVGSVVVTDPAYPAPLPAGCLVVAVGYRPAELDELLTGAAQAGAAGVLVKGVAPVPRGADQLAVLVVDPVADWAHLAALARTSLLVTPSVGLSPDDSLFALADALAALCGGPVVVHDPGWQLMAYSGSEPPDQTRAATLLGRRAPASPLEELRAAGVVDRLLKGELVHLDAGEIVGLEERYAAAVVVGGELLATIWVAPGPGVERQAAIDGLRRAVDVAALALLRHVTVASATNAQQETAWDALLSGAHTERLVAQRLGVEPDVGFVLAGLRPLSSDPAERAATARRLRGLAASHCEAYRVLSVTAATPDTVFMLFPSVDETARAAAVKVLTEMHARLQTTAPHRAMVSSTFESLGQVSAVRQVIEELLALADRRGWTGITDMDEVQAAWRLEQFREVALTHPALVQGPVARLVEHDRQQGTDLVPTLRTWFQCVGDSRVTAERMNLHVNTVRYRLRRAADVTGLDLDDADQRLLAELEVRLLAP